MKSWPLWVLLAVFLCSAVTIAVQRTEEAPPGATVLRIGHWQLEAGVREAFSTLGTQFADLPEVQAKYGRVAVVQDAIPDATYGQWLTSQVMGQTAPDLVEMGGLPDPILLSYQSRYFLPLTSMAEAPNPFNRGTPLEGLPLRETLLDGMRSGYQEELQAYMRVPLSRFTSRLFYNRTLLEKLTGLSEPPRGLGPFLEVCRKIAGQSMPPPNQDQHYSAIASSQWHESHWYSNVADPLTYANLFVGDFSRDGYVGSDETFAAIMARDRDPRGGAGMSLADQTWRARFAVTRLLDEQFNVGFAGVGRDEALFLFAQQRAVFISTGIWDVGSLVAQAQGKFSVGIADFPRPSPDDPDFGQLALGPVYDPAGAAFPFAVYRFSRHPDLAKDFLLYLASQKGNQQLNAIIGWIPNVTGVPIPGELARFAPVDQGIYPCGNLTVGGNTVTAFNELFSRYQTDLDYSYAQFVRDFMAIYRARGKADWQEQQRDWGRAMLGNEKFLAGLRGEALLDAGQRESGIGKGREGDDPRWITYRDFTQVRQLLGDVEHFQQERLVENGPLRGDGDVAPYDYLPQALENARKTMGIAATRSGTSPPAEDGR